LQALAAEYARLQSVAAEWVSREGDLLGAIRFEATADMRYAGQAFDLPVILPEALRLTPDAAALADLFHQAHEKIYSFRDPSSAVEVTTQRLRVVGTMPSVTLPRLAEAAAGAPFGRRMLHLECGPREAACWRRAALAPGQVVTGPAVVEQEDTTTVLLPGWRANVDAVGNLVARREPTAPASPPSRASRS
jgi:N-methylhydantoinase A